MKLKVPQLFSQRDSRWGNIILGYNTNLIYNIFNYGCLITSFGMYLGKTPDEVNQILKDNGGFTAGSGNFIWSKCTALGLNQTYSSPTYNDAVSSQGLSKIKESLDNGYPLICEIDFNPATTTEEMHYVLLMGYEGDQIFAADPWTGQIISLDVYGGPARAILQFRAYDKKLPLDVNTNDIILQQSDAFIAIATKLNVPANKDVVLGELDKLIGYEDAVVQKDKQIQDANSNISDLQKQLTALKTQLTGLKDDNQKLTVQVAEQEKTITTTTQEVARLSTQLQAVTEANNKPILTGWRKFIYDLITK